jgi:predicted nucleotidyltransferase
MLKALFSSKTRVELLKLFLLSPDASFYQRQIEQKTGFPIRAIQREIRNLCAIGLLTERVSGNRNYYSLNKTHPIRNELKNIILKTSNIADILRGRLVAHKDIKTAFIYGSYAKDKENPLSDIDLFVIGDISGRKLSSLLSEEKSALGREINFTVYPKEEFAKKLKQNNHFITSVMTDKKIFIAGCEDDLKAIRAGR